MTLTNNLNLNKLVHYQIPTQLGDFAKEVLMDTLKFNENTSLTEALSCVCDIVIEDTLFDTTDLFNATNSKLGTNINNDFFGKMFEKPLDYKFEIKINEDWVQCAIEEYTVGTPFEDLDNICYLEVHINFAEKDLVLLSLTGKLYETIEAFHDKLGTEYLYINGESYDYYM